MLDALRDESLRAGIGLGCMRLSTAEDRDEGRAVAVIHAALDAGARVLDTSPAYAHGEHELHHNEHLIRRALDARGPTPGLVVVTKTGLTRMGRAWVPDGRRKAIEASATRSAEILGGPLDLLLLHAVDPHTPLATSVRALESLRARGVVSAIGLSNVSRTQLEQALAIAPLGVVELASSLDDDEAVRSGTLALALERGIRALLHTPLGGPNRSRKLQSDPVLAAIARHHGVSAAQVALAFLRTERGVPLVGATRVETAQEIAGALALRLEDTEREQIRARRALAVTSSASGAEVVLLVGSQGAGKSRHARELEATGAVRMNRDERGGTLRGLAGELASRLSGLASDPDAARTFVLDNTYGTRAQRAEVLDVTRRAGATARAIWLDVPMPVAQANVVRRIVSVLSRLPTPDELRRSKDPRIVPPSALFRYARAFEAPQEDEGFLSIERRPFVRASSGEHPGLAISSNALLALGSGDALDGEPGRRLLVYGWAPDPEARPELALRARAIAGEHAELAFCEHGEGPPICWCRPPLPGLVAAWIELSGIDVSRSQLLGAGRIDRTIAEATGLAYRDDA